MNDVFVHPTAEVSPQARIGAGTKIWHQAQVRERATIGSGCIIGKGVYIDAEAKVGNKVKIQNYVSVYRGVTLEDDVFVGPSVTFTNDRFPRSFNAEWRIVPTLVKRGASIGANATIVCGVTVGEYALVAAGSVVTKNVPAHALVAGNPTRVMGIVCRCAARIEKERGLATKEGVRVRCRACGSESLVPLELWEHFRK